MSLNPADMRQAHYEQTHVSCQRRVNPSTQQCVLLQMVLSKRKETAVYVMRARKRRVIQRKKPKYTVKSTDTTVHGKHSLASDE